RIRHGPEAVAAVEVLPALVGDAARIRRVARPGAVVLEAAVHLVRVLCVHAHVVELRDGKVVRLPPAAAAVVGHPEAAVVAAEDVLRVRRVDPEIVPVAVRPALGAREASPAVLADDEAEAGLEEALRVLRLD